MKTLENNEMRIKTPRITVNVHTIYDTIEEARKDGWDFWFQYADYIFLNKDNTSGAIIRA